jgi:hypothetical protein
MKRALFLIALLSLAACGKREGIRPIEGRPLPPKPALATKTPSPEDMLKGAAEARPLRSDEPLTRSQERPSDYFDIPPSSRVAPPTSPPPTAPNTGQ